MKQNKNCKRCSLSKGCLHPCIFGEGNPKAKLMLIGEAPGNIEDRMNRPFVGPAGKLLDHILNKLSIKRGDVYITNVLKCKPLSNKLPNKKELIECWERCRVYFTEETKEIHPSVILLLGNTPLQLLSDERFIGRHEGSLISKKFLVETHRSKKKRACGFCAKLYASYHPAAALRSPRLEAKIATAIYVAAKAAGMKPKLKGMEAGLYEYEIRS